MSKLGVWSHDTLSHECDWLTSPCTQFAIGPFLVAGSRAIHFDYTFRCCYSAMLYLRGRGGLLSRGGILRQKIDVCGQQLVSPGGASRSLLFSNCEPLSPSAYYRSPSRP